MSNRLINETSPYLRQHSENPVDWYPWCDEAFQRAAAEDKPVFLSIGYSTCHWCHVMAEESFENERVAALLNRDYISVKVDREERPDIDSVYMEVCQTLSGSGGWPMTVIMTPERLPFFAATYIPRENRGGQPGLISLLGAVSHKWRHDRNALMKTAEDICAYIRSEAAPSSPPSADTLLELAAKQLLDAHDAEYGGFGKAPKFPCPHNLIFLMRLAALSGKRELRAPVENTLRQMYKGGIFDHFGGGFSRYSTDREWLAPHFEKTLYDNALLSLCYTEAWQDGHMALYRQVAEATLDWCIRELRSDSGGFFSALDADSEGFEGKYYLFSPAEVKSLLGEDAGRHFCECFDITEEGNFHGGSIPNLLLNTRWNFVPEGYEDYKEQLRLYRSRRHSLHRDEKILTGWNGLMLMALSRAGRVFNDPVYKNEANALAAFLRANAFEGGRPCRSTAGGCPMLEDYAFLALGLTEHYAMSHEPDSLSLALSLGEDICAHFAKGEGGLYMSPDFAEELIKRPLELYDGALPSGASAAAVLFDLAFRYTGKPLWRDRRDSLLSFILSRTGEYPAGCSFALCALLSEAYPTRELVCVSRGDSEPEMLKAVTSKYAPELTVLLKTPSSAGSLSELAPFTAELNTPEGKSSFYLCSDGACSLPFTD